MLTACWSVKGGSGTTVIAAAMTLALSGTGRPVVAADFGGDLAVALGVAEPQGPGLRNWLDAGDAVPVDGLERIAKAAERGITLVPNGEWVSGSGRVDAEAMARLADALRTLSAGGPVVADCGVVDTPAMRAFVERADRSFLVLRPCFLALRRAMNVPKPTAIVLINEPGRSLSPRDIEDSLGVPVAAVIDLDPAVAKAVDTGLLRTRLPRRVTQALRNIAA